jgi:hypothetical protein
MNSTDLTSEIIMDKYDMIVQSYKLDDEIIFAGNEFQIRICKVSQLEGGGRNKKNISPGGTKRKRAKMTNQFELLNNTSSIKKIKQSSDNLCFLRAVLIAIAYCDKDSISASKYYKKINQDKFSPEVMELSEKTEIRGPCGKEQIKLVEDYFKDYQIMVINGNGKDDSPIHLNMDRKFSKYIYLCLYENHYYVINSMKIFTNRSYYCDVCKIGFQCRGEHKCNNVCRYCNRLSCIEDPFSEMSCSFCYAQCNNLICYRMHNESVCKKVTICNVCGEKKNKIHICGPDSRYCLNCRESVPMKFHQCFMLTEFEKEAKNKKRNHVEEFKGYIFFDYECYRGLDGIHVPNLVIATKYCKECLKNDEKCLDCNDHLIFYENNLFCKWLFKQEHYIALAHNLKGKISTLVYIIINF